MKRVTSSIFFGLALLIPALAQAAGSGQKLIETITLKPDETKEVAVETNEKVKIGWSHLDFDAAKQCKNNCIELSNPLNSKSFSSKFGGSMGIEPKDGKALAVLKNVETIPLKIEIFQKPTKK